MTITLPPLSPETEQALRDEAERERKTPEQVAMEAMIAGLRGRRLPQTLDELPRQPLPPGMTLLQVFEDFWSKYPPSETDEEVEAALRELS